MPKVKTVGGWNHSSDAAFRAWVTECEQLLEASGLVRTSDTGQINPSTITRPTSSNSIVGYSMWRFNDALQAVSPVFVRVGYGSSGSTTQNRAGWSIEVGSATNGANSISAATSHTTGELTVFPNGPPGPDTTYVSAATHVEGFAALLFKIGGIPGNFGVVAGFTVQRVVDDNGVPLPDAVVFCGPPPSGSGNPRTAVLTYGSAPSVVPAAQAPLGYIPRGISDDSKVGLNPQVFLHWAATKKMRPLVGSASYIGPEIPDQQEFQLPLVGPTPRNYLAAGRYALGTISADGVGTMSALAILWED